MIRCMTALHEDPRVVRGMERQLELRRRTLDAGARPIGWKLGLGTPAAMEQHGTSAPLVGFLTDRGLCEPGGEVAIGAWGKPAAEPEVAVHVASDVPAGGDRDAVAAAIAGLGIAIELVDLGGGEVEEILAGDIFHRHVLLGPAAAGVGEPLRAEIRHGGEVVVVDDPWDLGRRSGRRARPPRVPPRGVRRDRPRRGGADHRLDRPCARPLPRGPAGVPARAARGAHGRVRRVTAPRPVSTRGGAILRGPSRRWRNW